MTKGKKVGQIIRKKGYLYYVTSTGAVIEKRLKQYRGKNP